MIQQYILLGIIPQRIENRDLNRYLYTNVHSSIIRNSQKVELSKYIPQQMNG